MMQLKLNSVLLKQCRNGIAIEIINRETLKNKYETFKFVKNPKFYWTEE